MRFDGVRSLKKLRLRLPDTQAVNCPDNDASPNASPNAIFNEIPELSTPGSSDGAKARSVAFCLLVGVVAYLGVVF